MSGFAPPTLPDGFDQQEVVGGGAMGSVYRVVDRDGHTWALKTLDTRVMTGTDAAEAVTLFEREARILARLAHPCFPLVADFFQAHGHWWLQMEYLEGRTLEQVVERNGPCPAPYLLPIACELARGLAVLHEHRGGAIIFRDLKPSNVMITDAGEVKLVDFGIARLHRPGAARDTQPLGTPGFAAPEQYGGSQTDARADLYALGATLYFALTGDDPGPASDDPPSVRTRAPECPPALDDLIRRCLQYHRERRPASAREVLNELERVPNPPSRLGPLPRRLPPTLLRRWLTTNFGQGSGRRCRLLAIVAFVVLALAWNLARLWPTHPVVSEYCSYRIF